MYLGILDHSTHTPQSNQSPAKLASTSVPFTRLYDGLPKGETRPPLQDEPNKRVAWKPVRYKDIVTYIRYAV